MVEDGSGIVVDAPPTRTCGPARPYYSPLHGARPPRDEQAEAAARLDRTARRPPARPQSRGLPGAAVAARRVHDGADGAATRPRPPAGVRRRDRGSADGRA